MSEECIKIDNHMKNVNIPHLINLMEEGDLAFQKKKLSDAFNVYWKIFTKTCGFSMIEKIMEIHQKSNEQFKQVIEKRLFAAVTHICSKVDDKNERYGILCSFDELMIASDLVVMARRIQQIQRKMIAKNEVSPERSPRSMRSPFWDDVAVLAPNNRQTAIASSYSSKK